MSFVKQLESCRTRPGELALFWLGQAGFLIRNSSGRLLAIDPYLSQAVERLCGLKRLMMPVMDPEELNPDYILITHHDEDHLDLDVLPQILARNPSTRLLAPPTAISRCRAAGIPDAQLTEFGRGARAVLDDFEVEAVFADHGDHAPDAVGFLVRTEGQLLYFSGDTSFQCERMRYAAQQGVDILILPINGEYGNMDSYEAVELAQLVRPKLTIPSHFWTFARHGSDPYTFELQMKAEAPELPFYFMCQGEMIRWDGSLHRCYEP